MYKFKFFLFSVFFTAMPFCQFSIQADSPGINYMLDIQYARDTLDDLRSKLMIAVDLLNKEGLKALPKIQKINKELNGPGIFVIDPVTGKILASPSAEKIGKDALKNSNINGKALAREAIKEARITLYSSDEWAENLSGELYRDYIYKLAITLEGRVFVALTGVSNLSMQKLFVTKIVDDACLLLLSKGQNEAFKIFRKENGMYCFKDTYLFVYQIKSDNNVTILFNPNFPNSIGKNIIELKVNDIYIIKEILKKLKRSNSGWVRSYTHIPTNKNFVSPKEIYFRAVNVNGEKLIIGSGVYLDK